METVLLLIIIIIKLSLLSPRLDTRGFSSRTWIFADLDLDLCAGLLLADLDLRVGNCDGAATALSSLSPPQHERLLLVELEFCRALDLCAGILLSNSLKTLPGPLS